MDDGKRALAAIEVDSSPPRARASIASEEGKAARNPGVGGFHLVFDPVYMVFDALHGVYMVKGGVAQLDPRLAGDKNSPPCRPVYSI